MRVLFLLLLFIMAGSQNIDAATASEVVKKAAAVVSGSKGIEVSFTLMSNGHSSKGVIKSLGSKFMVSMPEVSTWYNGKSLFTHNPRTMETTVTTPDSQELLESNPLLYIKGGISKYNCSFSKTKVRGKYVIDLVPVGVKSGLKKLTFTVNSANYKTEKIVVTASGGVSTVTVNSLKTGVEIPSSVFEYPKSKYPDAEIVDLR